jgi:Asp-tRNA(Asn)/Glu-tRNA(Gln) amidotransferase A subunit family amidase
MSTTSDRQRSAGSTQGSGAAELSALQATELLCNKRITAVEYATELLQRATDFQCINAFAHINPEQVWPCPTQHGQDENLLVSPFGPPQQVLADAKAVDDAAAAGEDMRPLCGLPLAVKDNIDVLG